MIDDKAVLAALKSFAESVTQKSGQLTSGEPEDQLRGPFETFLKDLGQALTYNVVCVGETKLPGRIGKPDFAVLMNKLLTGYVELKAPGIGADVRRFKGHNKNQWKRFQAIPNLLYSDGNEWALYRSGEAKRMVRLSGDISADGKKAVSAEDGHALLTLLLDFLQWEPIVPQDAPGLAAFLAPLCRMLRDDVAEALSDERSALVQLAADWRQLLFPDASNKQFADAYAQTVTFALLLAQSENGQTLTLDSAVRTLDADHSLLSRALQVLTDRRAEAEISASLNLLVRVVGAVPAEVLRSREKDPWLYFYEYFLAAYDSVLRKDAGAYYTPVEVVQAQVRLIDDLLTHRLGKPLGFADPGVVTLDPAVGTGTYLLGVIEHALSRVEAEQGPGAVPGQGSTLARNLYGFEIMVGPYAVAELRVSRALLAHGASLPKDGLGIYLTDTLEAPDTKPPSPPLFLEPIAKQHEKALKVKDKVPVIVCLGNPPYDRHEAASETNKARTGGWVRWRDDGKGPPILDNFIQPVIDEKKGGHLKNLYNLYVYFWRWALWKVFEHETARGPGVVSFISASSYLDGDAFLGFREHMRCLCDEIWILDLGGEGRGTRKSENVFAIQTPVAIAVAARYGKQRPETPAIVHYAKVEGSRRDKLDKLDGLHNFADLTWQECPDAWHAPFRPAGVGSYFAWPLLTDLFPWQHSGVEFKRTWPIAPDRRTLERRWRSLLLSPVRSVAFRETGDRKISGSYLVGLVGEPSSTPIADLSKTEEPPLILNYGYRSFDRQYILADGRLISRPRPVLWHAHSDKQVYLATLLNHPLGKGPALSAAAEIPDRHYFRGSYGAKEVIPLYRDAEAAEPNIPPSLLDGIRSKLSIRLTPLDLFAYTYGLLSQSAFTKRFAKELETRELRVPITKDSALFQQARDIGQKLIWLHTYGQRLVPEGFSKGQVPQSQARCNQAVSDQPENYPESYDYNLTTQTLAVGDGRFSPVAREVFEFEVSGLKVVKSWLNYRMKAGHGRKSSPLDDIRPERWTAEFTTELLELLWVLEHTLAEYPKQAELLEQVVAGPLFSADELPEVPAVWRKAPKTHTLLSD